MHCFPPAHEALPTAPSSTTRYPMHQELQQRMFLHNQQRQQQQQQGSSLSPTTTTNTTSAMPSSSSSPSSPPQQPPPPAASPGRYLHPYHGAMLSSRAPRITPTSTSSSSAAGHSEWSVIEQTIDGIASGTIAQYSFQLLHSAVVRMVSHELGDLLYHNLQAKLRSEVLAHRQELVAAPIESTLSTFQRVWQHYSTTVQKTSDFLYHYNRMYCEKKQKPTVRELGLRIFGDEALGSDRSSVVTAPAGSSDGEDEASARRSQQTQTEKLQAAFLRAVLIEREHGVISDEGACCGVVSKGLSEIDVRMLFEPVLEAPYLQELDRFHTLVSNQWTQQPSYTPVPYIKAYIQKMEEERVRAGRCLSSRGSLPKIESRMQEVWLIRHMPCLLQVGPIHDLLHAGSDRDEDLQLLFQTIASVGEAESLLVIFRNFFAQQLKSEFATNSPVSTTTTAESCSPQTSLTMDVRKYSALRKRLLQLAKLFYTERLERMLDHFVQGTLTEVISYAGDAFPAALVKYLDESIRTASEEELEATSEEVVILFRYVPAKDLFEGGCKVALARRLLGGASSSSSSSSASATLNDGSAGLSSLEREMIFLRVLKKDCGSGMVKKMEGMLSDIRDSFEVTQQYLASETGRSVKGVDISVSVLASGYWPMFPQLSLNLPQSLLDAEEALKRFYAGRHGGRRLAFCFSQGSVELRVAVQGGRRYEISCTLIMAVCLLQFTNDDDAPRGVMEIAERAGAPAAEVLRCLAGLCRSTSSAQGLLLSSDRPITLQSKFTFNQNLKAKVLRWRVAPAAPRNPTATTTANNNPSTFGAEDDESAAGATTGGGNGLDVMMDGNPSSFLSNPTTAAGTTQQQHSHSQQQQQSVQQKVDDDRRHQIDSAIVRIMKSRKSLDHQALMAETCRLLSHLFVPTAKQVKSRIDTLLERDFIERSKDQPNVYLYVT